MSKTLPISPASLPASLSVWRLPAIGALTLLMAACAAAPQPPTAELLAAQQSIASAEQARVADYASPELAQARDKLNAANAAVQIKEMDMGRRLAEQSRADAELALAKSQATKAKVVNDEMQNSTKSLKQEMQRNTGVAQ